MPVGVHRHSDAVVSHLFLHVGKRLPVLDEQRSERVAEVMNP